MYRFSEVPESSVPIGHRIAADHAISQAVKELGIPRPRLTWFTPDPYGQRCFPDAGDPWGFAVRRTGEIGILVSLKTDQVAETVRHECEHIRQWAHGETGPRELGELLAFCYEKGQRVITTIEKEKRMELSARERAAFEKKCGCLPGDTQVQRAFKLVRHLVVVLLNNDKHAQLEACERACKKATEQQAERDRGHLYGWGAGSIQ